MSQEYGAAIAASLISSSPAIDPSLLSDFAGAFWLGVQPDDLTHRSLDTDVELTRNAFEAFTHFQRDQPEIRWLPSSREQQSLLQILHPDMPFITDSVLMCLQRAGANLNYLHNVTLAFERDASGKPHRLPAHTSVEAEAIRETLIYAELSQLDSDQQQSLSTDLEQTLADVRRVVTDHQAMVTKAEELAQSLGLRGGSETMEAAAFLRWLCGDHFTFLGFRSFSFEGNEITQVEGSALGFLRDRAPASRRPLSSLKASTRDFLLEPVPISFSKAGTPSRVHRPTYPDYIAIKRFNAKGEVIGEDGFLGLYTSPVYRTDPATIPVLRRKIAWVEQQAGYLPGSYDAKALTQILNTYPRDELFQMPPERLLATASAIAHIHERRLTKVFLWRGRYGMFFNCLVYLPRDALNTRVRTGIQTLLSERLGAQDVEFDSFFSESVLVRLQYILRVDPRASIDYDLDQLEQDIIELAQDWSDLLRSHLRTHPESEVLHRLPAAFASAFPSDYQERFSPTYAGYDIRQLAALRGPNDLRLRFYREETDGTEQETAAEDARHPVHLKLFRQGPVLSLTRIVPMLEHFGFEVLSEHPYHLSAEGERYTIQDLTLSSLAPLHLEAVGDLFEEAFSAAWTGQSETDPLNALVLLERLRWQDVALLRSYARYMKQAGFGFEQIFIEQTLLKHSPVAKLLVAQFEHRLNPAQVMVDRASDVLAYLNQIERLNEDQVLRRLFELVQVTVRSNAFAPREDPGMLVHKLAPRQLEGLPEPKPLFEIFAYSPEFEGVHLRSSPVARGGIRWSDRHEDYRTEVLGLVKAQIVKNAVIVPSGAKGGFVAKRGEGPEVGLGAYRRFISAALSITDNLVDGQIVPPPSVHRRDGDDPYFVVAADKGTATFSDTANDIAKSHGFWLGDAFASGGSVGYDHKKMGITARGAWISVQRHFRALGIDPEQEPISVIGVGDMGGDVFGNGMLRSRQIKLLAAFNHLHIFIDPNPEPAAAFTERERLFTLPRSSWSHYDQALISSGGGVFSRTQKAIPISDAMQQVFEINATSLTGDELIQALLKAPIDLFWNGGIGTYVKASSESHADVGDRTNDGLRINGSELRARVVGEGGNLGLTHLGRIEFAAAGGLVNADFIDNAAGVDCSDHEVNLKILLGDALERKQISAAERDELLRREEETIAELVLKNNFVQARCLALARAHAIGREDEYNRLAQALETALDFDRSEADFPSEEALKERGQHGLGLHLPELSTLLGNAKLLLKQQLDQEGFVPDPELAALAAQEFPATLAERFAELVPGHRLHEAIATTVLANDLIGYGGITFSNRIMAFVGCEAQDAVRAYWISARVFRFQERMNWADACSAAPAAREALMLDLIRLLRRSVRWLIRRHRADLRPAGLLKRYGEPVRQLLADRESRFMSPAQHGAFKEHSRAFADCEAEEPVATAGFELFDALAIAELSVQTGADPDRAATAFRSIGAQMGIDHLSAFLAGYEAGGHWRAMERDALLDDLCEQQLAMASELLELDNRIDRWTERQETMVSRWHQTMNAVQLSPDMEFAAASMTVRKLVDLRAGLSAEV